MEPLGLEQNRMDETGMERNEMTNDMKLGKLKGLERMRLDWINMKCYGSELKDRRGAARLPSHCTVKV